jgi:hypothetical protein
MRHLALALLICLAGCTSLHRMSDYRVTRSGCPEMRFDREISRVDADLWATNACHAYLTIRPELARIYRRSTPAWQERVRVQVEPVIGMHSGREKGGECIPGSVCNFEYRRHPDGTPDLQWWTGEIHSLWRVHAFGLEHYNDHSYPSPEQVEAAAAVCREHY